MDRGFERKVLAERLEVYKALEERARLLWDDMPFMGGFTPQSDMGPVEYHMLSAASDMQQALESIFVGLWDLADIAADTGDCATRVDGTA